MSWTLDRETSWRELRQGKWSLWPEPQLRPQCNPRYPGLLTELHLRNLSASTTQELSSFLRRLLRAPWTLLNFSIVRNGITATQDDLRAHLYQWPDHGEQFLQDALTTSPVTFERTYGHLTFTKSDQEFPLTGLQAALLGCVPEELALKTDDPSRAVSIRLQATMELSDATQTERDIIPAGQELDYLYPTSALQCESGPRFHSLWNSGWSRALSAYSTTFETDADQMAAVLVQLGQGQYIPFNFAFLPSYSHLPYVTLVVTVQFQVADLDAWSEKLTLPFGPLTLTRLCDLHYTDLNWTTYLSQMQRAEHASECFTTLRPHIPRPLSDASPDHMTWLKAVTAAAQVLNDQLRLLQASYFAQTAQDNAEWEDAVEVHRERLRDVSGFLQQSNAQWAQSEGWLSVWETQQAWTALLTTAKAWAPEAVSTAAAAAEAAYPWAEWLAHAHGQRLIWDKIEDLPRPLTATRFQQLADQAKEVEREVKRIEKGHYTYQPFWITLLVLVGILTLAVLFYVVMSWYRNRPAAAAAAAAEVE